MRQEKEGGQSQADKEGLRGRYESLCSALNVEICSKLVVLDAEEGEELCHGFRVSTVESPEPLSASQLSTLAACCIDEVNGQQDLVLDLALGTVRGEEEAAEIARMVKQGVVVGLELCLYGSLSSTAFLNEFSDWKSKGNKLIPLRALRVRFAGMIDTPDLVGKMISSLMNDLEELDLSESSIDDTVLSAALAPLTRRNETKGSGVLKCLGLHSNRITSTGVAQTIIPILQSQPVERLYLDKNQIDDEGMEALLFNCMADGCGLRTLHLSENDISYVNLARTLFDCLPGTRLQKLRVCNLRGSVGDDVLSVIGAALRKNPTLLSIDLDTTHSPPTYTAQGIKFLADALRENSTITFCRIPDQKVEQSDPMVVAAQASIQKTLALNQRLASEIRPIAPLSRQPTTETFSHQTTVAQEDIDRATRGESEQLQKQQANALASTNTARSPRRAKRSNFLSKRSQEKLRELQGTLRAVRRRSTRHQDEVSSRLTDRVRELSNRLDTIQQQNLSLTAQMAEESDRFEALMSEKEGIDEKGNSIVEARIRRLEHRLRRAAEQCQALANVSKNVTVQLESMKRSLSLSHSLNAHNERDLSTSDRRAEKVLSRVVEQYFQECRRRVLQLQSNYSHDFETKQELWRDKMEEKMGYLVRRVGNLETSVISITDDNIFALEAILQNRQRSTP